MAKFGAVMVGCTGALMMFQTLCTSFASMAAVRFIMGMLESSVYPVSSIITVMWWTSKQQPIRAAFWNSQVRIASEASFEITALTSRIARRDRRRSSCLWPRSFHESSPPVASPLSHFRRHYCRMVHYTVDLSAGYASYMLVAQRARTVRHHRACPG